MEHTTITQLEDGYMKITPDEGYILKRDEQLYSEAVVKSFRGWSVIKFFYEAK